MKLFKVLGPWTTAYLLCMIEYIFHPNMEYWLVSLHWSHLFLDPPSPQLPSDVLSFKLKALESSEIDVNDDRCRKFKLSRTLKIRFKFVITIDLYNFKLFGSQYGCVIIDRNSNILLEILSWKPPTLVIHLSFVN